MRSLRPLFRFVLRIQGFIVLGGRIDREKGCVEIEGRRHGNARARCQHCRGRLTGTIEARRSRWRHLNLFRTPAYVVADRREGYCRRCGGRRLEHVPWASAEAYHTSEFDRQVARLVQVADRTAVTRMFGVTWRTVGRMIDRVVKAELPRDLLKDLRCISVDETSYKRGHRYLTIVSDLFSGRVVWVGKGKSAAALERFFDELGPGRCDAIEVVAMDMSGGYQKAVEERLPNAEIVFDKFHVVQLLTKAMDEIRREECRKLAGEERRALKGTRYALLRNPKKYTDSDRQALAQIERSNAVLWRALQHRVTFDNLWDYTTEHGAKRFLMRWTRAALLSRREPLRKFAHTVREHLDGILGYFRWGAVTNAQAEGLGNKVKLLIHKAFGFRNVDGLMAIIHLCCSGIDLEDPLRI